uniref:Uncharacterized protein n=1 Tax=Anguilla anguilla TaxID=7936 RepID=A0A0E9PFA6_ANGAN
MVIVVYRKINQSIFIFLNHHLQTGWHTSPWTFSRRKQNFRKTQLSQS